jgi:endonuclease/exonuclease/phosphatase (EEP) superfamily protein YafD
VPNGGTRANFIDLVAWLFVAFVGVVVLTQAVGWAGSTTVAIVQSLTPYLAMALVPVALVALWRRQLLLVTTACSIGFGVAVLATPLAVPETQPDAAPNSTGLRVASVNLWYRNPDVGAVADTLGDVDADVIVFSEFTQVHQADLEASALAVEYPRRIDRTGLGATGIAVWSRYPMRIGSSIDTFNDSVDLTIAGPDGDVRIVAMHMPTPIVDFDAWRSDLATAEQIGRTTTEPTLLIGDLNSSYWHPDFRRLLDAGFVDANAAAGSGFSTSWPTDWWIPPFVRLDHALTTGGLVSTDVDDLDVPGSDHRGLVVTVAPAR